MTTVVTRPDATVSNTFTLTGAASAHAALLDDSDSSYLQLALSDPDRKVRVGFAEPTIPAGALIKKDVIKLRSRSYLGNVLRLTAVKAYPNGTTKAGEIDNVDVTWTVATKTAILTIDNGLTAHTQLEVEISGHPLGLVGGPVGDLIAAYWETTYVAKPTVDSVSVTPASPVSDDDTPEISWTQTADRDGGYPTKHQVRVFTAAQYGAGGFNPTTSAATADSLVVNSTAISWVIDTPLLDATYRAYVRVANVVNGQVLWSDWEYVQFVLALDRPAVPTIDATAEDANGRIRLEPADPGGGAVSTDNFQVQRSTDGGTTWGYIRTVADLSLIDPGDTAYDYETGNGEEALYRARSLHTFASGSTSKSDWATSAPVSWSSTDIWLKHPYTPSLSVKLDIYSQSGSGRPARQGRNDVLGRTDPIFTRDVRGANEGPITFMVEPADLDAFSALIDANVALLVQMPPGDEWPDRWVNLGDLDSQRYVDKLPVEEGLKAFTWTEVAVPSGPLTAWT